MSSDVYRSDRIPVPILSDGWTTTWEVDSSIDVALRNVSLHSSVSLITGVESTSS